ncbi:MAG: AtpZ/AtpI family protein [Bradymonadales bacterium]|nr:MAG: AtpZ/AtpI family protein [Bradymonadales bacterium]
MSPNNPNYGKKLFVLAIGGSQFGIVVVAGILLGLWLDRKFGTTPWFALFGLLAGVASATSLLIRIARLVKKGPDDV